MNRKPIFDNLRTAELFWTVVANIAANGAMLAFLPFNQEIKTQIIMAANGLMFLGGYLRNPKKLDWKYVDDVIANAKQLSEYQARKKAEAASPKDES